MSISSLVRDPQQEKLLSVLRHAHGAEMTYDELRDAGIEFPATTISELELAGVPVERCYSRHRFPPSFRLDPDLLAAPTDAATTPEQEPEPSPAAEPAPQWGPVQVYGNPSATGTVMAATGSVKAIGARLANLSLRPGRAATAVVASTPSAPRRERIVGALPLTPARLLSGLALLAGAGTVAVLALSPVGPGPPEHSAGGHRARSVATVNRPDAARHHPMPRPHPQRRPAATPHAAVTSSAPPASTVQSAPTQLEARGHDLLQSGDYATAIPVLQQAVRATGESASACAQPTDQNCLTYAFALYDLGHALRLSGDPAAAVPILKLRLRVANQRDAVAQELQLAQSASHTPLAPASRLEARGHDLLQSGEYATAIPVLQQAVRATGVRPGACAQPTDQNCLTYAFALYDLGHALRLSGDPAAAVPILKLRLGINNQHDAVAEELAQAQSASR